MNPPLAALAYLQTWEDGGLPPDGVAYEPLLRRIRLDYSPASLARIDTFLDALRTAKRPQRDAFLADPAGQNLLLLLAFYAGEVVGRALGCAPRWLSHAEAQHPLPLSFETSLVCRFPDAEIPFAPLVALCDRLFKTRTDRRVAGSAAPLMPDTLRASTNPRPTARAFTFPLDLQQCVGQGTPADIAGLAPTVPDWAPRDPLGRLFDGAGEVLRSGRVMWGALVQANGVLFRPEPDGGAPGEVVYDPVGRATPEALMEVAQLLLSMKGRSLPDPGLAEFSAYLLDDRLRVFGLDVPRTICPYPLKVSTTFFDRSQLPGNVIAQGSFPVVVSDRHPGLLLPLPAALWPAVLLQAWLR